MAADPHALSRAEHPRKPIFCNGIGSWRENLNRPGRQDPVLAHRLTRSPPTG